MLGTLGKVEVTALLDQAARQEPGKWHEVTRINGAAVYLVRSLPATRDYETHDDVDEFVVVLEGAFRLETPEGFSVAEAGQSLLVPRGVPHRGRHHGEVSFLLIR